MLLVLSCCAYDSLVKKQNPLLIRLEVGTTNNNIFLNKATKDS